MTRQHALCLKKEAPAGYGVPGLLQEIVAWVTINKCHDSFLASTYRSPGGCQSPNAAARRCAVEQKKQSFTPTKLDYR
jgi:hypothetical protein